MFRLTHFSDKTRHSPKANLATAKIGYWYTAIQCCANKGNQTIFLLQSLQENEQTVQEMLVGHISATTNWGALNQPHYFSQTHLRTDQIFAFLTFTLLCLVCMIAWFSPLNCKRHLSLKLLRREWLRGNQGPNHVPEHYNQQPIPEQYTLLIILLTGTVAW